MRSVFTWFFLSFCLATTLSAADFPPVTDAERALTEVPMQPGAPAVTLFSKAEMRIMDYPKDVSSVLNVAVRRKILTEEGKAYGEVEIPHSAYYRLRKVRGRTVLPDGREVPLPKDAIFEERTSKSLKRFVTKLVFPQVEVGAILDYSYTVRWDDLFYLEPWYLQSEIPSLLSEISYVKPANIGLQPWVIQHRSAPVTSEARKTAQGAVIYLRGENLPGVPDEPYSWSFEDLSARSMMVPVVLMTSTERVSLLENWESTVGLFFGTYKQVRRSDRKSKKQAQLLAQGKTNLRDKVRAVYEFVRDDVRTVGHLGVGISDEEKVDEILEGRVGTPIAKALLLQAMLEGLKIDSDLVWAYDQSNGRADLSVANPWWFDTALVRVMIDGEPLYLDAADHSVGFGRLAPGYEGTQAVVVQKKDPPTITLPSTSFEGNLRRARVQLTVDEEGRVSGQGTMELKGHAAWGMLGHGDPGGIQEAWAESLSDDFEGYEVQDVSVEEDLDEQTVHVSWNLLQREEEVLGDEVTLQPALPLGPLGQPFTLPAEQRRTPIQMSYGRRDDLLVSITWPEGWTVDVLPEETHHEGPAGQVEWKVAEDPEGRQVEFQRRFDRREKDFMGADSYRALRNLYQEAAKADAQNLVLVLE